MKDISKCILHTCMRITQKFNLTNRRPCWMHFPDWLPERISENDDSV